MAVTNTDNDTAGITVTPTAGLTTTEAGGTATFTVRLNTQPTADVTIALASSDTTEGTVAPASLTFTPANFATPQTVTITGVERLCRSTDDIAYTIVTGAGHRRRPDLQRPERRRRGGHQPPTTIRPASPSHPASITTTESGVTATFTVRLNSQPTAAVTIALSSSDPTEGTVAPASLTFTPANWNTPQTVTATGVDDLVDDGDVAYTIVTAPAASADPIYNTFNAADVAVTNTDDDVAGITVTPVAGLTTSEAGGTATFTVGSTRDRPPTSPSRCPPATRPRAQSRRPR